MRLTPGSIGPDVARLQAKLKTLYPQVSVNGNYDLTTERALADFRRVSQLPPDTVVTAELLAHLERRAAQPARTFNIHAPRHPIQAAGLANALRQLGHAAQPVHEQDQANLHLSGHPNPTGQDIVYPELHTWPFESTLVKSLNKAGLVLARTPLDASGLNFSGVVAPLRVLPLPPETTRYVGVPHHGTTVFGYAGPKPAEIAKLFLRAFGTRQDVRLVCQESTALDDPRISTAKGPDWLVPLTCLIAVHGSELVLLAVSMGKAVVVPKISAPDHGLTEGSAYLVDNAFYAGNDIVGLPFSRESLLQAMLAVDCDKAGAGQRGLHAICHLRAHTMAEAAFNLVAHATEFISPVA